MPYTSTSGVLEINEGNHVIVLSKFISIVTSLRPIPTLNTSCLLSIESTMSLSLSNYGTIIIYKHAIFKKNLILVRSVVHNIIGLELMSTRIYGVPVPVGFRGNCLRQFLPFLRSLSVLLRLVSVVKDPIILIQSLVLCGHWSV